MQFVRFLVVFFAHFIVICLKSDVGLQSSYLLFREVFQQFKLIEALQVAMQPTKIDNGTCHIKVDVRVAFQFVKA